MTTLLAVDDSKTMRRVIEITFAGENHRLVLAENADDAVKKLRADQPSVVLLDANLGGSGGGYALCQSIKREAPHARVLILSSKQQPYDRPRGASSGADDFIDKPFDTQQLIDKVNVLARAAAAPQPVAAPVAPAVAHAPAAERQRAATQSYGSPATAAPRVNTVISAGGPPAQPAAQHAAPPAAAHPAPPPYVAPQPAAPPHVPTALGGSAPVAPVAAAGGAAPRQPAFVAAEPPPAPPAALPPTALAPFNTEGALDAGMTARLQGLGLTPDQVNAVLALSREVVERVVWEVVPTLAETLIKEEIRRLTAS